MTGTEPTARRGDLWLAALGAGRAGEPGKNRPVLVVSSNRLEPSRPRDLVLVVPVSSSVAQGPDRPRLAAGSGLRQPSVAVCRALRGVALSRLLERLGTVSSSTMDSIDLTLARLLDLEELA